MAAKLDPAELKKGKSQSYKDCPMSFYAYWPLRVGLKTTIQMWILSDGTLLIIKPMNKLIFDSSLEFMKKLIISILDDPFKMVRYLGA